MPNLKKTSFTHLTVNEFTNQIFRKNKSYFFRLGISVSISFSVLIFTLISQPFLYVVSNIPDNNSHRSVLLIKLLDNKLLILLLISTALLLDSIIRNSVCIPAKLPCRRVEVGYEITKKGRSIEAGFIHHYGYFWQVMIIPLKALF
jgi:hypothetical protein